MSELTALTDKELDAVCGGILDIGNPTTQTNTGMNFNLSVLSLGGGGDQHLNQGNFALFNSPILPII